MLCSNNDRLIDYDAMIRVVSLAQTDTFEECLSAAIRQHCSREVDEIFAVLNLIKAGAPSPVNYERTVFEACRKTSLILV
jgi:hypothetical protein